MLVGRLVCRAHLISTQQYSPISQAIKSSSTASTASRMLGFDASNARSCCSSNELSRSLWSRGESFCFLQQPLAVRSAPRRVNPNNLRHHSLPVRPNRRCAFSGLRSLSTAVSDTPTQSRPQNGTAPKYTRRTSIKDVKVLF